jgi:aromatic-L-amino-acid/L-tryptophan decarboxylase
LCEKLRATQGFEIVTEPLLSLFSFRYVPAGVADLDGLNLRLVEAIKWTAVSMLRRPALMGEIVLQFQAGQFECTERDVAAAYEVITEIVRGL